MKKRINFSLKILFLVLAVCLSGCAKKQQNPEKEIIATSKKVAENIETTNDNIHMNIVKKSDRFLMYPDGYENEPFTMLIPCNFYEENPFELPTMKQEEDVPNSQKQLFEKAQKVAMSYVDISEVIKEEDKSKCKEALENVTLHFGEFLDLEEDVAMVTNGNDIYLNSKCEKYMSEYLYLHELIHVISNVTNEGSKYEYSSYRSSMVNEVITDLIAVQLAEENGFQGCEISGYQLYYEPTYYMLAKFNMIETYFYSEGYQEIIDKVGQYQLDMYILLVDNYDDGVCSGVIYYLVKEWLQ